MQKLVFFFSMFLILSCGTENSDSSSIQSAVEPEARIWLLRDTITSAGKWVSDSVRQVKLDLDTEERLHLEAKSDATIYLFYGDKLMQRSIDGYLEYSFQTVTTEKIFLSLDENVQEVSYGVYKLKKPNYNGAYSSLVNVQRESKWVSDNFLLILLIGATLFMVLLKVNYDKRYSNILSFNKILTFRLNEGDQSRVRIMDQDNLVFAGFYAFLTSGLIYFLTLGKSFGIFGIISDGIVDYLKILAIVAIGLIAKVILVSIASNLFGNSRIPAFYIKEMLNINLFFVILLFFGSIFIYLFSGTIPALWLSISTYTLLIFYLTRLILLYFKILKLSSFTNLYLFSYFCTTEIFPFLIGLKYFVR